MSEKSTLSSMFIDETEPTTLVEPVVPNAEDTQVMMFLTNGRLGQGLALVESSLTDKETTARLRTAIDKDGAIWLEIETQNGVHVMADALPLSNRFTESVYVNAADLCHAVKELAKEAHIGLWVDQGKLYLGAYYNDEFEGFELECGFAPAKEFTPDGENEYDTSIEIDQASFNTILDAVYEFEWVEIYRMKNTVSFRTGNDKCTIATVMQNQVRTDDILPDLSVRIPAKVFKTLPLVNALDDGIAMSVTLKMNTKYHVMKIEGQYSHLFCQFSEGQLKTFNNDGMSRQFTIMSDAIAAAIGTYFNIHSTDPTGLVRLYAVNDGLLGIETVDKSRMDINLTVGNVTIDNIDMSLQMPMDVLTMMIRNSGCPKLDFLYNKEAGRVMMAYGNGYFLRKCCYQA